MKHLHGVTLPKTFLNMGIILETDFSLESLLKELKRIELRMGRVKSESKEYSDRLIDLDILFYNELEMNSKNLKIPHPKIVERKFSIVFLGDLYENQNCRTQENGRGFY